MATIDIDIIENARWLERDGLPREIIRLARVSGLTAGSEDAVVRSALDESAVPQPGEVHPSESGLILKERRTAARGPTIIDIECVYRRSEELEPPDGQGSIISGGVFGEQITTAVDRNGVAITVAHDGITTGVEARVFAPRRRLIFERTEQTDAPGEISDAFVLKTNSVEWNDGRPGSWICLAIPFEQADRELTPPSYRFRYDFFHKDDGDIPGVGASLHDPEVIYIDPETDRPPPSLVAGIGFKIVPWYFQVNFFNLGLQ